MLYVDGSWTDGRTLTIFTCRCSTKLPWERRRTPHQIRSIQSHGDCGGKQGRDGDYVANKNLQHTNQGQFNIYYEQQGTNLPLLLFFHSKMCISVATLVSLLNQGNGILV